MSKQVVFGFDIDGVLADLSAAIRPRIEEEFDVAIDKDDVVRWNYYVEVVGSMKKMLSIMDDAWEFGPVPLEEPDIAATMARLKNKCHRLILSARTRASHPFVVKWLHQQGIGYDSLALVGAGVSKFAYPVDVLLDDRPSMVEEVRAYPNKFLLLRDQPWNRDETDLPPNAQRVSTLGEAVDVFLSERRSLIRRG